MLQPSQHASGPSKLCDVFGGDSNLSLTSDLEADHEELLVPRLQNGDREMDNDKLLVLRLQNRDHEMDDNELFVLKLQNRDHKMDDKESHARESLYKTDNKGLYANDPANSHFQGANLYYDDDQDTRMDVDHDAWGDDQEFPSNLDDSMFNFRFYLLFTDYLSAIEDSSENSEEGSQDRDKDGLIFP